MAQRPGTFCQIRRPAPDASILRHAQDAEPRGVGASRFRRVPGPSALRHPDRRAAASTKKQQRFQPPSSRPEASGYPRSGCWPQRRDLTLQLPPSVIPIRAGRERDLGRGQECAAAPDSSLRCAPVRNDVLAWANAVSHEGQVPPLRPLRGPPVGMRVVADCPS